MGNTRVILTHQKDTAQYMETMEAANRTTENALFYNIPPSYAEKANSKYKFDPVKLPYAAINPLNAQIRGLQRFLVLLLPMFLTTIIIDLVKKASILRRTFVL